ncbi:MAG: Holliday junction resolvase RuvX [Lachnospiraceae bacterium]|nr:Holliday junction resolvase RuvX [Lachnospiraceae bacterium]
MGKRIMGLDFGAMTCGVAISDELQITAQGIETIRRTHENKLRKTLARIEELIMQYDVDKIVLGLPKKLDGSEGERAEKSRAFKEDLERRTGLEVVLWDERLTTVEAHRALDEAGMSLEKKNEIVDKIAAVIILRSYLDYLSMQSK